ncbi:hypothetical protein BAE44_0020945, partial [Dichanthelium oligosanthes]
LVGAIILAIAISCSVVHCSEVQAVHDGAVAHLDGTRRGLVPPAPSGGPVHAYEVPPPPQMRRLLHRTGRSAGAGSDADNY